MKIGECMGVLHSFTWDYVKYANMEGFCTDNHNWLNVYAYNNSVAL